MFRRSKRIVLQRNLHLLPLVTSVSLFVSDPLLVKMMSSSSLSARLTDRLGRVTLLIKIKLLGETKRRAIKPIIQPHLLAISVY